jgi:hypothetical protein
MLFLMVHQIGDRRKANIFAVGSKKMCLLTKKNVDCLFYILMELNKLCGNLIMLCTIHLPFLLTVLPLILRMEHP